MKGINIKNAAYAHSKSGFPTGPFAQNSTKQHVGGMLAEIGARLNHVSDPEHRIPFGGAALDGHIDNDEIRSLLVPAHKAIMSHPPNKKIPTNHPTVQRLLDLQRRAIQRHPPLRSKIENLSAMKESEEKRVDIDSIRDPYEHFSHEQLYHHVLDMSPKEWASVRKHAMHLHNTLYSHSNDIGYDNFKEHHKNITSKITGEKRIPYGSHAVNKNADAETKLKSAAKHVGGHMLANVSSQAVYHAGKKLYSRHAIQKELYNKSMLPSAGQDAAPTGNTLLGGTMTGGAMRERARDVKKTLKYPSQGTLRPYEEHLFEIANLSDPHIAATKMEYHDHDAAYTKSLRAAMHAHNIGSLHS